MLPSPFPPEQLTSQSSYLIPCDHGACQRVLQEFCALSLCTVSPAHPQRVWTGYFPFYCLKEQYLTHSERDTALPVTRNHWLLHSPALSSTEEWRIKSLACRDSWQIQIKTPNFEVASMNPEATCFSYIFLYIYILYIFIYKLYIYINTYIYIYVHIYNLITSWADHHSSRWCWHWWSKETQRLEMNLW